MIGILFEKKRGNTFKNIHTFFPSLLAKLSKEYNLKHFIHLSALGINEAKDSAYANSKVEGENNILKNAPHTQELIIQENWEFPYSRKQALSNFEAGSLSSKILFSAKRDMEESSCTRFFHEKPRSTCIIFRSVKPWDLAFEIS